MADVLYEDIIVKFCTSSVAFQVSYRFRDDLLVVGLIVLENCMCLRWDFNHLPLFLPSLTRCPPAYTKTTWLATERTQLS